MYYVVRNKSEEVCRVFNCLSTATSFVNKNKGWAFCNMKKGYKRHTEAVAFLKAAFENSMILGNNGSIIYRPKDYKSSIDKTFELINQGVKSNTNLQSEETECVVFDNVETNVNEIIDTTDTIEPTIDIQNPEIFTMEQPANIDKGVQESEWVNTGAIDDCVELLDGYNGSFDFEFDEDYDNVLGALRSIISVKPCDSAEGDITRDNIDTIISRRLDEILEERGIVSSINAAELVVDNVIMKNVSIAELPTYVTDINKQLITMLLHLDIFELQRVFSDFSTALVCVDGSYKEGLMAYAYIMLTGGKVIEDAELCCTEGKLLKKIEGTSTQAEFMSVRQAIAKAAAIGVKDLIICYDCESIISTLSGVSLRTAEQRQLKSFVDTMSTVVNLHFVKVKAHSGVPLHTRADVLAGIKVGRSI